MFALMKRLFLCISTTALPLLYKTLVLPHIDYRNLMWGPFNKADLRLIECVQSRTTKLVPELRDLPYPG